MRLLRYNLWATNYLILCIYRRSEEKWKSFSPNPVDNLIIFIMVNHVGNGWFEKKLFRAQRTDDLIIMVMGRSKSMIHRLWVGEIQWIWPKIFSSQFFLNLCQSEAYVSLMIGKIKKKSKPTSRVLARVEKCKNPENYMFIYNQFSVISDHFKHN